MKKRTAIYCYFSVKEKFYAEVVKQLRDLRNNVDYLIVVVNGKVSNIECLTDADKIFFRPNIGLDAGAYKYVIMMPEIREIISNSDELILCNSTFFGPFCGFKKIFDTMDKKNVDFWGINFFANGILKYIQSYFLVYEKKILNDKGFYKFFEDNINEYTNSWQSVCYWFEYSLFEYLQKTYKYDCFINDLNYDIYENSDICLEEGLPILKKKVFSMYYNDYKIKTTLKLINKLYGYSLDNMLYEVYDEFGVNIKIKDIDNCLIPKKIVAEKYAMSKKSKEDMFLFCKKSCNLYIYGTGVYGLYVFNNINKNYKIRGFLVSDIEHRKELALMDKDVFILDDIKDRENSDVIIALNKKNTDKIRNKLLGFRNVFNLWE